MSKPTHYDLLLEVQKSVNRLEDKLDVRMKAIENRVNIVESKTDQIMGKIGVTIALMTSVFAVVISLVTDWLKKTFIRQ